MTGLQIRILAGLGLLLVLGVAAALVGAHLRADARLRTAHADLTAEAAVVLVALRDAADNPQLSWVQAPGQIVALGEGRRSMLDAIDAQNARINDLAAEAVRLRARAEDLRLIAAAAQEQRRSALARLSDMAITPGTRDDCMALLAEAEQALDLVREAGL